MMNEAYTALEAVFSQEPQTTPPAHLLLLHTPPLQKKKKKKRKEGKGRKGKGGEKGKGAEGKGRNVVGKFHLPTLPVRTLNGAADMERV
jgi:hypothetical protein